MVRVNLAKHLTVEGRYYSAGNKTLSDAEAAHLRGLDGVTLIGQPSEAIKPAPTPAVKPPEPIEGDDAREQIQ